MRVAPAVQEAEAAFLRILGTPARPIRTLTELQAWVDATAPAQAAAERRREELIQEFYSKPSAVLGF